MQEGEEPVYDFPDPQTGGQKWAGPQRGSLKSISVLDRLLLTHPVWLQLSINAATALHILQREPPGTFLVRKSSTSQRKVLCVRLADDSVPSFVKQFVIRDVDSAFALESAAISFPDLCRLVAFYCVSRDVLPFTLELPVAIAKATSHKQLESISHMGVEFWSSQLNFRGPRDCPPAVENGPPAMPPSPTPEDCATPQESPTLFQEFCPIRTRSPKELNCGRGQGALCFINPMFLQLQPAALHRRNQFKRSMKVRVSTESSSPLSPPVAPPPPPPLLAKAKVRGRGNRGGAAGVGEGRGKGGEVRGGAREGQGEATPCHKDSDYLQPSLVLPKKTRTMATPSTSMTKPTLSPTEEEDDYHTPKPLLLLAQGGGGEEEEEGGEEEEEVDDEEQREEEEEEEEEEGICLVLEERRAPSLSELDSCSSMGSLEEAEESPERPAFSRGSSVPVAPRPAGSALRKLSAAFVSFFVPEKRVALLVEELGGDRRTAFGALLQDFLQLQREEELKPQCQRTAVELLQGVRLFLSQAKNFLLDGGELEPPIETLVPEEEIDLVLEKALFRCVLKPLKGPIDVALQTLHETDGSAQRMRDSLRVARGRGLLEMFGVRVGVPDARGVEKVGRKLRLMQRAYSPIDKVVLLLQVCKIIYNAMTTSSGEEFGADDFLPALSYVLVQVNMAELLSEVEYMMELLDQSWLTGEGGYYLTSVYASLCLIQSQPDTATPGGLTLQAKDSLRDWSRRRSNQTRKQNTILQQQRCVRVLFQGEEGSVMRTVQWKAGVSVEALAQLCADRFGVDHPDQYQLYWRCQGQLQPLDPDTHMQHLQGQGGSGTPLIYQPCQGNPSKPHPTPPVPQPCTQPSSQDGLKNRTLTREGAVDLLDSP